MSPTLPALGLPSEATMVEVVSGALLVAVIVAVVFIGRRMVVALARARDAERFRSTVADFGARIDTTLGGLVVRVDAVRRRQLDVAAIAPDLDAILQRLPGFAAEADAIHEPSRDTGVRPGFAAAVRGELERAERAIRMIEYGCQVLTNGRGGFARSPDGETALKRGYLNLLHAREALAEDAAAWSGRPAMRRPSAPVAARETELQAEGRPDAQAESPLEAGDIPPG